MHYRLHCLSASRLEERSGKGGDMTIKVLWVDEEPHTLRYESRLAEARGWKITWVSSADEGMHLVKRRRFDLLVVDLILPLDEYENQRGVTDVENGLRLVEQIRVPDRKGRTPCDVPMVVVSAVITPKRLNRVLGFLSSRQFLLSKPIPTARFNELLSSVDKLLIPEAR